MNYPLSGPKHVIIKVELLYTSLTQFCVNEIYIIFTFMPTVIILDLIILFLRMD